MTGQADIEKINAAAAALDFVENGMVVGLGTGSTAGHFVRLLGERVRRGLRVRCVPTSEATARLAVANGLTIVGPDDVTRVDVCVDGADEADEELRLIKGGGGALLREKIVAAAASHFVVIVDGSKLVERLGAFPLPVEVTPFGFTLTARHVYQALKGLGCERYEVGVRPERGGPAPFVTDGGNYVLDCQCAAIPDPERLADALSRIPGVVEHGLFLNMARTLLVGRIRGADILER